LLTERMTLSRVHGGGQQRQLQRSQARHWHQITLHEIKPLRVPGTQYYAQGLGQPF
jgi:hypothetical protein